MPLEETGKGERIIVEVSFPNLLLDLYIIPEPPPGNLTPPQTGPSPELADRNFTLGGCSGAIPIGCVTHSCVAAGHRPTAGSCLPRLVGTGTEGRGLILVTYYRKH